MKRLTKIVFNQWYLFDSQEIPVVGNTAVLGGNGAGKSSILDGVQILLAGGDRNKISLNKGSNERSARTVREYCLGIVSDPTAVAKIPSRDSANTYIVLCFYDDERDEHICAGIAIWATAVEPKEDVRGYFITKGAPLSADDFTEETREGLVSLPWERVRDRLLRRFRLGESLELPNKGPGDFSRKFYTIMSAEPGMPVSAPTVVKSLLSAISFKPINDPTKFVRDNMLDSDHINIRELSESLKFWRGLRDKAVKTKERIGDLSVLEKLCGNLENVEREIVYHEHVSCAARIERCYELSCPKQVELDEIEEELILLEREEKRLDAERERTQEKLWQKRQDYKAEDVSRRIEDLNNEKRDKDKDLNRVTNELSARRTECLKLRTLRDAGPVIPQQLSQPVENLLAEVEGDDLLSAAWPGSPSEFDALLNMVLGASDNALPMIKEQSSKLWQQIVPIEQEQKEMEIQAAMLANKQAPLGKRTRGLMELLAQNRIDSIPLCDLIDVADERWCGTVEAVLGGAREALIVKREKARDAIRIYRYEGKSYRGALVVNTTKTAEWEDKARSGSLAEKVITDDPHARAFINLRLGNIICVEKESELLQHRRAATADLMLNSGGTITMMDEVQLHILGRQNREDQRRRIQRLIDANAASLETLQQNQERIDSYIHTIQAFVSRFQNCAENHRSLAAERDALETRIGEIIRELDLLRQKENTKLKQIVEGLEEALKVIKDNLVSTKETLLDKREARGKLEAFIEAQESAAEVFQDDLERIRSNPLLDQATASDLLEKLRDKFAAEEDAYTALINQIDGILVTKRKSRDNYREKVIGGLQEFLSKNSAQTLLLGEEALVFDSFEQRATFISREKARLEETTLAEYESRAENALKEVEVTFRTKFISRLVERLGTVRDNIAGLNKILKNRPFHGEIYQFRCIPNSELEKVFRFAKAVEEDRSSHSIGGLFDPANDPESPHREAIDFINKAFQDDDAAKLVADYRNYYVFDVEMFDRDGNKVANLKHRIAKGSGGENMAPFYVAIGSSLSAAYRIVKRPDNTTLGGMNLAPFDEAFSKLDAANCYNCLEFLKDTGLQVLLAAPDEKYPTLAAQVDTVIWIYRDGGDVEIETEFLTARTHDLLRSDNPFITTDGNGGAEAKRQSLAGTVAGGLR